MHLESRDAEGSPCSVDPFGLDDTRDLHVGVQQYQQQERHSESQLGEYSEYSDLPYVVETENQQETDSDNDEMVGYEVHPVLAAFPQKGGGREYGKNGDHDQQEYYYPYDLVSFNVVYEVPEPVFPGSGFLFPSCVHISKGF